MEKLLMKLCRSSANVIKLIRSRIMTHKPLIVVLGATGAGKSKLAIDIGQKINGEIINADAMQMYQGLDIVTNKVTEEETKMCPHHMIGFLSPKHQFTIVDFQKQALKLIDDIHDRNKVPILVGGTNYYVESVLWDTLIKSGSDYPGITATNLTNSIDEIRKQLYGMSNTELYQKLQSIDPALAATTHPKDKRKVIRGLEVYYQTGKLMSDHLSDQRRKSGGSNIGGPLRYPQSCILWVQCDKEILCDRIRRRVDQMMSRGLLQELADFHSEYNKERLGTVGTDVEANLDREYEYGIFQSIGFKEFHEYLTCVDATERKKETLLSEGIERMKMSTWQYAKYQTKWINKRIVNRAASLPVYGFDGTDPTKWQELVLNPALGIIRFFYSDFPQITSKLEDFYLEESSIPQPLKKQLASATNDDRSLKECSICEGKLVTSAQWEDHLKSRRHKRIYGLLKKKQTETTRILKERERQLATSEDDKSTELAGSDDKLFEKCSVSE